MFSNAILTPKKQGLILTTLYVIFVVEAFYFAFTTIINFDELSYVFKGYQLAINKVDFLEPFTFWWNKMVLSFSFWGWVQVATSPGLLWVRISVGILNSLSGLFLLKASSNLVPDIRRSIFAVLLILNFPLLSNWSVANSQVLVNFLFTLSLYLLSFPRLNIFRLIGLGATITIMIFTRENMIFFLPPVLGYVWAREGWKKSLKLLSLVGFSGLIWFIFNFPNDLLLLTRFLPIIRYPDFDLYEQFTREQNEIGSFDIFRMLHSFSFTIRIAPLYFWSAFSATLGLILKRNWSIEKNTGYSIFLVASFWSLLLPHIWVTQGLGYCSSCLATYTGFFISLGALLFVITPINPENMKTKWPIKMIFWGIVGFTTFLYLIVPLQKISQSTLDRDGSILPVMTWLVGFFANLFSISGASLKQMWTIILTTGVTLLAVSGLFLLDWWISKKLRYQIQFRLTLIFTVIIIISGFSDLFLEKKLTTCKGNIVFWAEKTAKEVSYELPSQPVIYLNGESAALPLLYLEEDYEYFMPQINSNFSYSDSITDQNILRFGLWNETLAQNWKAKSNVFFFDKPEYEIFTELVDLNQFQTYNYAYRPGGCDTQIELFILVRNE